MQVYIGIDWSENKHDVVFMNEAGADLACLVIAHTPEGFAQLDARRRKLGLAVEDCQIGMETAHSILIDYLWSQDYTQLYVLPPNQVKSNQGRFRQSGAKDDSADARLIAEVETINADIEALADGPDALGFGTGGMVSKLAAARIATAAGCPVLLTSGLGDVDPLGHYLETGRGTLFHASAKPMARRKQWLQSLQLSGGTVRLDAGAVAALQRGASLLARGVVAVEGNFGRGELVRIIGPDGTVGQGLSGYGSEELSRILGHHSDEFEAVLGYAGRGPVLHRDDLILFMGGSASAAVSGADGGSGFDE